LPPVYMMRRCACRATAAIAGAVVGSTDEVSGDDRERTFRWVLAAQQCCSARGGHGAGVMHCACAHTSACLCLS
jgi:hypothetical protein